MKRLLFIPFFIIAAVNTLYSQEKLDSTYLMCQYKYTYMNDTLQQTRRDDLFILEIGPKISKFYSYYTFQYDSLMSTPNGEQKKREIFNQSLSDFHKHRDRRKFLNGFSRKRSTTCIYKNYPEKGMTIIDFLGGDYVVYEDVLNDQDWQITDNIKTVLNYNCQQAICRFRGREWIVWFTTDIPVANGPWKLGGLPGLILEAYDRGNQYYFNIIGLEKKNNKPILFGESFFKKIKYIKTNRKEFLKACKRKIDNASGFLGAETGVSFGNNDPVYYDLIERDYR
ncbi:MAG: GLPGLI family protein [Bacteroides graminisolvens]|nr:GLPGLI family protein [Bacteroides graminisolvens]